jgi:hypothetical protein
LTYDLNYAHISNNVVSYSNNQGIGFFHTQSIIRVKALSNTFTNVGFYNENLFRIANPDMATPMVVSGCTAYRVDGKSSSSNRGMLYIMRSVDVLVE